MIDIEQLCTDALDAVVEYATGNETHCINLGCVLPFHQVEDPLVRHRLQQAVVRAAQEVLKHCGDYYAEEAAETEREHDAMVRMLRTEQQALKDQLAIDRPSTASLVQRLDERCQTEGEKWTSIHRLWDGRFGIELSTGFMGDPLRRTVTGATIEEVLQAAIASKRIPTVPRRPKPICVSKCRIEKRGSGRYAWHVFSPDGGLVMRAPTRKDAQAGLERWVDRSNEEIAEWDSQWAQLTTEGTEDTDFIWSKS